MRISSFPNAIAWNAEGSYCAVVFPFKDGQRQMDIIKTANLPKVSTRFIESMPHSKDVNCVEFLPRSDDKLITAGADHRLYYWYFFLPPSSFVFFLLLTCQLTCFRNLQNKKSETHLIHSLHSASIYCISINSKSPEYLFSGSPDRRFIAWNLQKQREVFSHRLDIGINAIKENPQNPDILLVGSVTLSSASTDLCLSQTYWKSTSSVR